LLQGFSFLISGVIIWRNSYLLTHANILLFLRCLKHAPGVCLFFNSCCQDHPGTTSSMIYLHTGPCSVNSMGMQADGAVAWARRADGLSKRAAANPSDPSNLSVAQVDLSL